MKLSNVTPLMSKYFMLLFRPSGIGDFNYCLLNVFSLKPKGIKLYLVSKAIKFQALLGK